MRRCLGCMEEYDNAYGLCPHCGYEPEADVENPLHMQPGVLLRGRYQIGRVLGYGGFGVTYLGWDFTLRQKVAIKEYLPSEFATRTLGSSQVTVFGGMKEAQFDDGLRQFVDEAKRLARFQQEEGIVRVFDSFTENNTAYIIMEYLDGETLTSFLNRNGKLSVDEAVRMLTPVMRSLEAVHNAGLIHRDIAPDNIFLTKSGQVKLIDFGAARHATTSHSRSLTVIIKPGYSPEEQYRSRGEQGTYTDVYALGAVLYRMVTGMTPPDSMERRALIERDGSDPLVVPDKKCTISANQQTAILNALNVQSQDRTPTVGMLLRELLSTQKVRRLPCRLAPGFWKRIPLWVKIAVPAVVLVLLTLAMLWGTGVLGRKDDQPAGVQNQTQGRVPSIVNESLDVARSMLLAQGLDCQVVGTQYSEVLPPDVVVYQSVVAGQALPAGSVVEVYVSTNENPDAPGGSVPTVTYKTEAEAKMILDDLGVAVTVEYEYSDLVAQGLVISQYPAPGDALPDAVTIVVSKGEDPNKEQADGNTLVLEQEQMELYVGDSVVLYPRGGDGKYAFSSDDSAVVTVDAQGKITAVGAGSATITVTSGKATPVRCVVTVADFDMKISREQVEIFQGTNTTVTISGIPVDAMVQWSSRNSDIASVDKGVISGVSTGETIVTAVWVNGQKTYSAQVRVKVGGVGISLSTNRVTGLYVGDTKTIQASTSPNGQSVLWSSTNSSVVKVDNGVLSAVSKGTAVVRATMVFEGKEYSAECQVTVSAPSVSLNREDITMEKGESFRLTASANPGSCKISWRSENSGVAKVSGGTVTAVSGGRTRVIASIQYQGKTYEAVCSVSVLQESTPQPTEPKPTTPKEEGSIQVSPGSLSLCVGDKSNLKATVKPSGTTVKWSSDNPGVASVSNGTVAAVGQGRTTIRARITVNGKTHEAVCTVTVLVPEISITASATTLECSEISFDTCKITARVTPDGGGISWSCSDPNVATVEGNGKTVKVTAKRAGSVNITARYSVAGKVVEDSVTIKVNKAASQLDVQDFSYTKRGTKDSFTVSGTISSNYALDRVEIKGRAYLNEFNGAFGGVDLGDSEPFYFNSVYSQPVYSVDASILRDFFVNQYLKVYEVYVGLAGILGADNSITGEITVTVYDSSGNSISREMTYVIYD